MLMMDSITRFAIAQERAWPGFWEPPVTRIYPFGFAVMPKLLERAGTSKCDLLPEYTRFL